MRMKVVKVPYIAINTLTISNCAIINDADFPDDVSYIEVTTAPNSHFVFTVLRYYGVPRGSIGINAAQRDWTNLSVDQEIEVGPYYFDSTSNLATIILEADSFNFGIPNLESCNTIKMARDFLEQFSGQAFVTGQKLFFLFDNKMFHLVVRNVEFADPSAIGNGQNAVPKNIKTGLCLDDTVIQFATAENICLNVMAQAKKEATKQAITNLYRERRWKKSQYRHLLNGTARNPLRMYLELE